MKALLFAAGRGERLRPLTDHTPKPLIEVAGRTLLERHIETLAASGFEHVVINTSYLSDKIIEFVNIRQDWGIPVSISHEPDGPLETGGGMLRALPLLGNAPFLAINADIVCNFPLGPLSRRAPAGLAHLVMVPNPSWKPAGDFELRNGTITGRSAAGLTFSGIGVYRPEIVQSWNGGSRFSIVPILVEAMARGQVTGERHDGVWFDAGTPERLQEVRNVLRTAD